MLWTLEFVSNFLVTIEDDFPQLPPFPVRRDVHDTQTKANKAVNTAVKATTVEDEILYDINEGHIIPADAAHPHTNNNLEMVTPDDVDIVVFELVIQTSSHSLLV